MRLPILIFHDAGNEVQDIAKVVSPGVDDVDDVEAADGFLGGDLRGIDGRWRFVHIHDLANFLLMGDGHLDAGAGRDLRARVPRVRRIPLFRHGVDRFLREAMARGSVR